MVFWQSAAFFSPCYFTAFGSLAVDLNPTSGWSINVTRWNNDEPRDWLYCYCHCSSVWLSAHFIAGLTSKTCFMFAWYIQQSKLCVVQFRRSIDHLPVWSLPPDLWRGPSRSCAIQGHILTFFNDNARRGPGGYLSRFCMDIQVIKELS